MILDEDMTQNLRKELKEKLNETDNGEKARMHEMNTYAMQCT